MHVFYLRIR